MTKLDEQITRHHIICKSRGGTNNTRNIEFKKRVEHRAWHTIFINLLPHEQLKLVLELNGDVLRKGFKEDVLAIIDGYEVTAIYHPQCVSIAKLVKEVLDNDNNLI